ncbi:MAG: Nif3-like dinuclear metal center hexameric protein [bacterium]|nr:Nif3-like dinuclear metal center hexameric protein [bacterium]
MQVKDITALIEKIAPLSYQENYDNAGLIIGNHEMKVTGILLCLDSTERVVDEAIEMDCNLIIAHHPIVFKGIKKLNGTNYVERTIIKAIRHNIAIYAMHTNLDNVLKNGVNTKIAEKLELSHLKIIQPKIDTICKLVVYTPKHKIEDIKNALFENGAGQLGNYSECSFESTGTGSFKPGEQAKPHVGNIGIREEIEEVKIEVLVPNYLLNKVLNGVKAVHPYEEMAYDIVPITNQNQTIGAGIYGELAKPLESNQFLQFVKEKMNLPLIRHTAYDREIRTVAICGGSGSFLIQNIKNIKADAYITADIKYHEFFDVENQYMLCDIGHYESEIYTLEIFYKEIKEKFPTFAVIFCKENTNPIQYFK